ncbi:FAD-binding oxidoreductase [Mycobacteriaceae bacterium NPDC060252]
MGQIPSGTTDLAADETVFRRHSADLRKAIKGQVLLPGDPEFAAASKPWNTAVIQRARALVVVNDAEDAAALVRYAREAGLTISVQPNGHGAADDLDGVVLVRTGRLNELRVDPEAGIARIGSGVQWGQVLAKTEAHNLIGLAGSSADVNVTGFTLGGGISWFGRKYGLAVDSVIAFDIVDTDGYMNRVTAQSDPELFWAIRGGGGDFALVTAIEFRLYPAPVIFGGQMLWPVDRGPEVMAAFREVTLQAPDELSVWFNQILVPGGPSFTGISTAFLGSSAEGRALLAPFDRIGGMVVDSRAVTRISKLDRIASEPTEPCSFYTHAELLTDIDSNAADALTASIAPLIHVEVRHLGGRFTHPSDSAAGPLESPYLMIAIGIDSIAQELGAEPAGTIQHPLGGLRPVLAGRKPFTFLAPGETASRAFNAESIARLRDIKRRRDPHNVIRSNYPVLN